MSIPQVLESPASAVVARGLTPTHLPIPVFLLSCPLSFSAEVPNNVWMQELTKEERVVDRPRAIQQFLQLYHFLAAESLVFVLPAAADCGLQDLVFTANLGIVLSHVDERSVAVISNFSSPPREGETTLGVRFFERLGYEVFVPHHKFEGEAELKHLHDNVYVGGYGTRSELAAYRWMEDRFGLRIVALRETDSYLYHLDCTVFPLTRGQTLFCPELYTREEVRSVEKVTEVVAVSANDCYSGICNSVRVSNTILNASNIHELSAHSDEFGMELAKNRRLEDIASRFGFEVTYFNLSEFLKGGALLSCMVMHLNRQSYDVELL